MYAKGKSNNVPSDSQAREKLALYVYEYLLHVGAQKSAQTFLSEIRWEKNITLGEPPGFLHSWWCVFWDLYCAAPERRETCEHSSEAKAFHDYVSHHQHYLTPSTITSTAAPHWCLLLPHTGAYCCPTLVPTTAPHWCLLLPHTGAMGVPGNQPMLPSGMDPTRQQGHPNMGGPMQRMTPPRGMVSLGPQNYGGGMRPPLNALVGPGMPGMNIGYYCTNGSVSHCFLSDSTNSGDNMYTLINTVPPGGNRPNFPMGPGADGPMGGMAGMEPHHMNGSLGSGDMDSLPKNSPGNLSLSNQPGTPREDGEMGGNFLNPFQNESVSSYPQPH
uniref:LisH domain-containing protein n=1 Tax=Oncorhynchus tshawytscha TaxID=74940 RepID=A0AAZ3RRL8_ONCTS